MSEEHDRAVERVNARIRVSDCTSAFFAVFVVLMAGITIRVVTGDFRLYNLSAVCIGLMLYWAYQGGKARREMRDE